MKADVKVRQCKKCKSFIPIVITESNSEGIKYNLPDDLGDLYCCAYCGMRQMAIQDRWYDTEYEYPMHKSVRPKTLACHWFSTKGLQPWSWSVLPMELCKDA